MRGLHLDQKRNALADQRQYFDEVRDRFGRAAQTNVAQLRRSTVRHLARRRRQPIQIVIVEDDGVAIPARLDVELDALALDDGCLEGGAAVLDPPLPMQPTMGEGAGDQPGERGISRP